MFESGLPLLSLLFGGQDHASTVHVRGQLTAETAGAFTTSLFAGGLRLGLPVVVDISGVTRLDGEGARALQICGRSLREQGSEMIVRSVGPQQSLS